MKIILSQRHLFNRCKPMVQIDEWVQWDECDLSDCPPYREKGSMTAHGKFPRYKYEELPTVFKDTNGDEHNIDDITYRSIYDLNKIKTLYSNIDTVSFWKIGSEIKLLEERGYSTKQMETKLHKSLSFPFFLLSMVFLSGVFTLGTTFKENNLTYIFVTIVSCILVYFFNDFSAALGKTERLSVEIAVWMPTLIIFIFSTIGMIYANQK